MDQKQFIRYELALDCVSRTKAILAKGLQEMGFRSEAQKLKPVMIFFQKLWDSNLRGLKDKPEHIEALIAICSNIVKTNKSLENNALALDKIIKLAYNFRTTNFELG